MTAKKPASRRSLKSDLTRVDAHRVRADQYDELPELTEAALKCAAIKKSDVPAQPIHAKPSHLGFPLK
jgi:hypothetical protein